MKNTIIYFCSLMSFIPNYCQNQQIDTLFANEHQIVSLFFDSPIEKGIVGSDHFIFTYNQETPEPLGLLQAYEGVESNLLVITQNGSIYSLVLAYRDSLSSFHNYIDSSQKFVKNDTPEKDSLSIKPTTVHGYDKLCKQLLRNTTQFHQIKTTGNIRLKLTKSIYHNDEVYVVYEIRNTSPIDYQINRLQLLKVLGNSKRKASYQEIPVKPLHSYRMPKIVAQGNTMRFVVVYPKFTLGANQSLKTLLQEKDGSRNFTF